MIEKIRDFGFKCYEGFEKWATHLHLIFLGVTPWKAKSPMNTNRPRRYPFDSISCSNTVAFFKLHSLLFVS